MSACSSQLSASLLGSESEEEANSGSRVIATKSRHAFSAGKVASSKQASRSAKQHKVPNAPGSAQQLSNPTHFAVSTPRAPQTGISSSPISVNLESVASQGPHRTKTPESSASTGASQTLGSRGHSSKPSWQQATAVSSRHSQHSHTLAASRTAKPSFLARLQDNASSSKALAVPVKNQQPLHDAGKAPAAATKQQHDTKAAEMRAKLQEWREQQQQQKVQKLQAPSTGLFLVDHLTPLMFLGAS